MDDRQALERVKEMLENSVSSAFETLWTDGKDVSPLTVELVSSTSQQLGFVEGYLAAQPEDERKALEV